MKRNWTMDELMDDWTLQPAEIEFVDQARTDKNRMGLALLLKWFQKEHRFPRRRQEVPASILGFLASQMAVDPAVFRHYPWQGRTLARHHMLVRTYLGFRETTVEDAETLTQWLIEAILPHQRQVETLQEGIYDYCREQRWEPPTPQRIERIIHSALRTADAQFCTATMAKLPLTTLARLDALLKITPSDQDKEGEGAGRSALHALKQGAGAIRVDSLLVEIDKLEQIEALELPADLFRAIPPRVLDTYRQRVAVEDLHEVQRHPEAVRYTLLAAFCWQRRREIIDTLVDLLIDLIHRLGIRAEHKVDKAVIREIKRVRGKNRLLVEIAEVSIDHPEGLVKDVIYPVADEQTLRDVIAEFKATGSYDQQVRSKMRSSYGQHYRRMVPAILRILTFRSNKGTGNIRA